MINANSVNRNTEITVILLNENCFSLETKKETNSILLNFGILREFWGNIFKIGILCSS